MAIKPVYQRLMMAFGRGVLSLIDDNKKIQLIQVSLQSSEIRDGIERFQNYGFTSVPLKGAEVAVAFVGGNRSHGIALAVDDRRHRIKGLENGEVAIYTDEGDKIHLKRNNVIEITTNKIIVNAPEVEVNTETATINASTKILCDTPLLECTGDIVDNSGQNSLSMQQMRSIYNTHTHEENPNISGPTEPPNQLME